MTMNGSAPKRTTEPSAVAASMDFVAPHQGGKKSATRPEAGGCIDKPRAPINDPRPSTTGSHQVPKEERHDRLAISCVNPNIGRPVSYYLLTVYHQSVTTK
jgi:hypothetical protein